MTNEELEQLDGVPVDIDAQIALNRSAVIALSIGIISGPLTLTLCAVIVNNAYAIDHALESIAKFFLL